MDEKRTYIRGFYYNVEGDNRVHFDYPAYRELEKQIPERADDKCPECGSTDITGCRCPQDHRFCKCGCEWQRQVNKRTGNIDLIINRHGKNENTATL